MGIFSWSFSLFIFIEEIYEIIIVSWNAFGDQNIINIYHSLFISKNNVRPGRKSSTSVLNDPIISACHCFCLSSNRFKRKCQNTTVHTFIILYVTYLFISCTPEVRTWKPRLDGRNSCYRKKVYWTKKTLINDVKECAFKFFYPFEIIK